MAARYFIFESRDADMTIEFFVPGKPATAGSKRAFYNKALGRAMITDATDKTKPWMNTVAFFARQAYQGVLLEGPLKFVMEFRLLRPKGHYGTGSHSHIVKPKHKCRYQFTRPDLTKLVRAAEDALKGIIWRDDAQVSIQVNRKIYVDRDPGAMVQISEIVEADESSLFENPVGAM